MGMDDSFISPELDLQIYQSNIDTGPDYDAVQLQQSVNRAAGLLDSIKTDTEAIVSLEAMRDFITGRDINKTSAILFNIASEGYGNLNSLIAPKMAFSLEGFKEGEDKLPKEQVDVAMENLAQSTAELASRLGSGINNAMMAMGDIVHGFDRGLLNLKKRISAFEAQLESIKDKDDIAYNYVKPENNFTYLMYTQDGFTNGIKPVMDDVNWFLNEHADMVSDTVGKYRQWFNENRQDINNPNLINSLEFKPEDFLLSGSTLFNRSVGNRVPSKGSVFYRSKELPGGRCLYTEVRLHKKYGIEAVDALTDVNYFMDYYEPDSFKVTEKYIYNASALSVLAWASIMLANPLPMAIYGLAVNSIADKTKTNDIKKVRITPETIFPTLSKDGLFSLLQDLKTSIGNLEKWNKAVYSEVWRDKSVQAAVDQIVKQSKDAGYSAVAIRNLKQYSVALISLMSKSYIKVHVHSFSVINAALNYGTKSANQYR
jgi:hypothetical protein